MEKLILPELGEEIKAATVACWHVRIGDEVKQEDDLVELVTDKASFNVPAGCNGRIREVFFQEGEEASIGSTLALIEPLGVKS